LTVVAPVPLSIGMSPLLRPNPSPAKENTRRSRMEPKSNAERASYSATVMVLESNCYEVSE
jgi:hypothetical protein